MKTITALLAVASLTLAACGSSSSSNTSSSSSGSSNTTASSGGAYGYGGGSSSKKTTAANTSSAAGTSITVAMKDYSFGPKVIAGKPGSTVHVKLVNNTGNEHNFKIDGQKADADVEPGEDATVSVKIPTSGSVQFYCEYHKGLGMVGTVKAS